jgi:hypothetical protein
MKQHVSRHAAAERLTAGGFEDVAPPEPDSMFCGCLRAGIYITSVAAEGHRMSSIVSKYLAHAVARRRAP